MIYSNIFHEKCQDEKVFDRNIKYFLLYSIYYESNKKKIKHY